MISDTKKFIFIHIPKTGGSAVTSLFKPYSRHKVLVNHDDINFKDGSIKHMPAKVARERFGKDIFSKYFKFSIIRNPWERIVSYAAWETKTNGKALQRLGRIKRTPQTSFICDEDGNLIVDMILRYENLNQDIKKVCKKLNIPFKGLKMINKSSHKHYRQYYTKETRDQVAEMYKDEIKMFGYKF